jgi:hypothetical protein
MSGNDNIPVDIEFLFKSLNTEKEAAKIKKEITDVGAVTDKVAEQVEANFTESFTNSAAAAAKMNTSFRAGATGVNQLTKSNNQLSYSVQQVARELPNIAISPQLFIMAISNNLPILQDQLRRTRLENEALKASGVTTVPVFKQVIKSIFSWQTALIAIITMFTVFGKEIFQWVGGLLEFGSAAKLSREEIKKLGSAMSEGLGSEFGKMDRLFDTLKSAEQGTSDWNEAKNEIIGNYGKYLSGMDAEITSLRNVEGAYRAVTAAIVEQSKAKALDNVYQEQGKELVDTTTGQYKLIRENLIDRWGEGIGQSLFLQLRKELESGQGLSYAMNRIINDFNATITKQAGGSVTGFTQTYEVEVNAVRDAIGKISDAQDSYNGKIAEAQALLGNLYGNAPNQVESLIEKQKTLLKQAQLMPESTEAEIEAKNKLIRTIEEEIERLNNLGKNGGINSVVQQAEENIKKLREKLGKGTVDQDVEIILEIGNQQEVIDSFNRQVREGLKKALNDDVKITALKPVAAKVNNETIAKDITKQLAPMKQLTEEERKQLQAKADYLTLLGLQTEKYNDTIPIVAELLYYSNGIVDSISKQLDLSDKQTEALKTGVKAMSAMAEIASGNVVQGAAMLAEAAIELFVQAPEKLSEKFENIEKQVQKIISSLNVAQESLGNLNSPNVATSLSLIDSGLKEVANSAKLLNNELSDVSYGSFRRGSPGVIYGDLYRQAADLNEEIEKLTGRLLEGNISDDQRKGIESLLNSYNSLMSQIDSITQELTGTTVADFSAALSDAVLEGADAWDVWEQKAIDVIKHVASQQLATELLNKPITDAINVLVKGSSDGLSDEEAAQFKDTIKAIYDEVGPAYEAAIKALQKAGIDLGAGNGYEQLTGSAIQATEESVSLLYGQLTALRIDVKSIVAQMAANDDDFVKRLAFLKEIAENTRHNKRLAQIETGIQESNRYLKQMV